MLDSHSLMGVVGKAGQQALDQFFALALRAHDGLSSVRMTARIMCIVWNKQKCSRASVDAEFLFFRDGLQVDRDMNHVLFAFFLWVYLHTVQ